MKSSTRHLTILVIALFAAVLLTCSTAYAADKLSTPTNLHWETEEALIEDDWGAEWDVYPGYISWEDSKNTGVDYFVDVYTKDGDRVYSTHYLMDGEDATYFNFDGFTVYGLENSGQYRFTVQAVDPENAANNSDVATSDYWTYTKPSKVLDTPVNCRFAGAHMVWDEVADADGYLIELYYSASTGSIGELLRISAVSDPFSSFKKIASTNGDGCYTFRVRSICDDVTKAYRSGWSDYQTVAWTNDSLGDFDFDAVTGMIIKSNQEEATSITVPESIDGTKVTGIERMAFANFKNLKSITLPKTITEIRPSAFNKCTALTDVYFKGSRAQWNKIKIATSNKPLLSATMHYDEVSKKGSMKNVSAQQVEWEYYDGTKEVVITGEVAAAQPVLIASYDESGRFLSMTPITSPNGTASLEPKTAEAALFWVDEQAAPVAEHAEFSTL